MHCLCLKSGFKSASNSLCSLLLEAAATVAGHSVGSRASRAAQRSAAMPLVKLRTPLQRIRCYVCSAAVFLVSCLLACEMP